MIEPDRAEAIGDIKTVLSNTQKYIEAMMKRLTEQEAEQFRLEFPVLITVVPACN